MQGASKSETSSEKLSARLIRDSRLRQIVDELETIHRYLPLDRFDTWAHYLAAPCSVTRMLTSLVE